MKKIIFFASTLILLIITSCSFNEEVDMEELVVREEVQKIFKDIRTYRYREGVVYRINSQKPFTGIAKGVITHPYYSGDSNTINATFKDGKLNGLYVVTSNQNKILTKTNLKDGRIEGFFEQYYPSGQLKVKFKAKDGRVQGRYESYHDNGQSEVITDCNGKESEYYVLEKYKRFDKNGKELTIHPYDGRSVCLDVRFFSFIMKGGRRIGAVNKTSRNGVYIQTLVYNPFDIDV